eukprot:scaffold5302_cov174-Isochrysis_galbana.AAC.2
MSASSRLASAASWPCTCGGERPACPVQTCGVRATRKTTVCCLPNCAPPRIELTREYSARQKAEQNQGTAFVHT